jgi:hypothetical protein
VKHILWFIILYTALLDGYSQRIATGKFAVHNGLSGGFDVGVASKTGYFSPSLTYYELTNILKTDHLLVGWTGRLSTAGGDNLSYYTAPRRLTRVPTIDTVQFNRLSQTSLNVGLRAEFNLGRVQIGGSTDLLGLTFLGRSRTGLVYSSTGGFNGQDSLGQNVQKPFQGADAYQQATPTRFNLRLLGDNDRGMLTTEVYVRVYFLSRVALKLGYQWLTTEISLANTDVVTNNARFRNRTGLPYAALTFPLSPW